MIIWRIALWHVSFKTRGPLTPQPTNKIWMWVRIELDGDVLQLKSQTTTSFVANGMRLPVRERLSSKLYKDGNTLHHPSVTGDPWMFKDVVMNILQSDNDVMNVTSPSQLSVDDVEQQVERVRSTLQHHVMTARAHADRDWRLLKPYPLTLWDVTHRVNLTTAIQNMSFHEAWLNGLNAALLAPVRCRWASGTP